MVINPCPICNHYHAGRVCGEIKATSYSIGEDVPQDRAPMTDAIDTIAEFTGWTQFGQSA